jgi:protease-4
VPPTAERVVYLRPPAGPAKRSVWRSVVIFLVLGLAVVSILVNLVLFGWMGTAVESGDDLREKYVSGSPFSANKVAVVNISGMIAEGSGGGLLGEEGSMELVVQQLRKARADKKVVAVVLEVNSPGGSVTASDIILHEVERTKKAGKRVVVWMGSLAASGGYYVSCKADTIYASPTTLTGSIGVIMSLFNVEGLSDKIGLKMQVISCGKFKEMGSPFRAMSPEERERFQAIVDSAYGRFKRVIAEGRKLTSEEAERVADGAVLTSEEALSRGLIDRIDYFEAAVDDAKGPYADVAVVRYHRPLGLMSALLSSSKSRGDINVHIDAPMMNLQPGLYYLWLPGLPAEK